jgi:outer membrane protein assembly factor BamB
MKIGLCGRKALCNALVCLAWVLVAYAIHVPGARAQGTIAPQAGYWWNPTEPGRGFVIEIQGQTMFMASFLYASSGEATWLASIGQMTSPSEYSGSLITYYNGQTLTGPYQVPTISQSMGAVSISFSADNAGTLTWPGGTLAIQRFDFGPGGAAGSQPSGTPQTGWWYDPTAGGRGFAIEVQGGTLYLAGYMYDATGFPTWYVCTGPMSSPTFFFNAWQTWSGGQTIAGPYKSPTLVNDNIGGALLQFSDPSHATIQLPSGEQVSLSRFQFAVNSGQPPLSPWPGVAEWQTFQGNAGHTGYVPVTLDTAAFNVRWNWRAPATGYARQLTTVTTANGQLYLGAGANPGNTEIAQALYALKEYDGSQVWSHDFSTLQWPSVNPPATSGNSVFVAAGQQNSANLWAFNGADGSVLWQSPIPAQWDTYYAPIVSNGIVYQDTAGAIQGFDVNTGKSLFRTWMGYANNWSPAADANNVYGVMEAYSDEYGVSINDSLYVMDASTGALKQSIEDTTNYPNSVVFGLYSAPVIGAPGSVFGLVVGSFAKQNALIDFNVTNSSLVSPIKWQLAGMYRGNPAYNAGTIYAVNQTPVQFEARAEADGSLLWSWIPHGASENSFVGDVLLTQNMAFVSTNLAVYAIDLTTHNSVWTYPTPGRLALSPNGILYIVTTDGTGVSDSNLVAINVK